MPMCDHNFTVCSRIYAWNCVQMRMHTPPPYTPRFFWRRSAAVAFLLRSFSNISSSIPHRHCRRFYIFRDFFSLFFLPFFVCSFPHRRTDPALSVYLRSADAHNGCTKVTELAGVQRTTWVRVGLRGRALQTIAGLQDHVIVFFFKVGNERTNERKKCAMIS